MSDAYKIVQSIVITEKSAEQSETLNKFTFKVAKTANKIEIAKAVSELFDVKVDSVNTMNKIGKKVRQRTKFAGKKANWKKAIVTLAADQSIDLF